MGRRKKSAHGCDASSQIFVGQLGTLEKAGGRLVKRNCEYIAEFFIVQNMSEMNVEILRRDRLGRGLRTFSTLTPSLSRFAKLKILTLLATLDIACGVGSPTATIMYSVVRFSSVS